MKFEDVSKVNLERCNEWHSLEDWNLADWAVATAGELGELCNVIKKLKRANDGVESSNNIPNEEVKNKLMEEAGGTFLYLDLLIQRAGLTWNEILPYEFNRISEREGLPQRLEDK